MPVTPTALRKLVQEDCEASLSLHIETLSQNQQKEGPGVFPVLHIFCLDTFKLLTKQLYLKLSNALFLKNKC